MLQNFYCFICRTALIVFILCAFQGAAAAANDPAWSSKFDARVRFYQMTELGVLLVGTEKSLYAVDGEGGEILWRRKNVKLDEADVAPVSGTDLVLLNSEDKDRTRFEAVDILTGDRMWRTEKVRGAPMQMAIDLDNNLLAVVVVKDAKGDAGSGLKRRPVLHVFSLLEGEELWRYEIDNVEMMPARWSDGDETTVFTLDNYQPPLLMDNRLYMFYEGVVSLDARTGKERVRERFKVNEDGLALTEADPVFDNRQLYVSGQGKVRAISRDTGREVWEAKDLGLTPQMMLANNTLFVRTGGQFTRLKDGETVERGSYGVSAIDASTGKTLWRYRGADRGITNMILTDESTVALADRDDLIFLNARTGDRVKKLEHKIKRAAFVLINESGETVVGGTEEVAAFNFNTGQTAWRVRHTPPSRGIFRIIAAVALRAASFYFRYGSLALTGFRGLQIARSASTLRWSGLARTTGRSLTSLAASSARERISSSFTPFGIAARGSRLSRARTIPEVSIDVEERLLDRIDPASQMDKLSRLLLRRRRLATLRGEWMYFYTDLKSRDGRGLAGVNVNNGRTDREIRLSDLDDRFIADEAMGLLFIAKGDRMLAFR